MRKKVDKVKYNSKVDVVEPYFIRSWLHDDGTYTVSYGHQVGAYTSYKDFIGNDAKERAEDYIYELVAEAQDLGAENQIYRNYDVSYRIKK